MIRFNLRRAFQNSNLTVSLLNKNVQVWIRAVTTGPNTDPFGIENSDEDINQLVQGIYMEPPTQKSIPSENTSVDASIQLEQKPSSSTQQIEQIKEKNKNTQKYKEWLEDAAKKQLEAKLNSDSEVVRPTAGGAIRLDADNPARRFEVWDENNDFITEDQLQQHIFQHTSQKNTDTKEKEAEAHPKASLLDRIIQSNPEIVTKTYHVPSIYHVDKLNDLTHQEVWSYLRKRIVFQNDFLIAINKPYGLPMHSPSKECRHTVLDFLDELTTFCSSPEPVKPLHRLDKDTTGVLIFGKTERASTLIKERFATCKVKKTYLVVTKNCPPMKEGRIDIPIGEGKIGKTENYRSVLKPNLRKYKLAGSQNNAQQAVTEFQVIGSVRDAAFLSVTPITGVKHQIRIHLGLGLGCPIIGDHKYSHTERLAPQRLSPSILHLLNVKQSKVRHLPIHIHCLRIEFTMPESFSSKLEPVLLHCKPPLYFMNTVRKLRLKK